MLAFATAVHLLIKTIHDVFNESREYGDLGSDGGHRHVPPPFGACGGIVPSGFGVNVVQRQTGHGYCGG